jgi:hypothetical protein
MRQAPRARRELSLGTCIFKQREWASIRQRALLKADIHWNVSGGSTEIVSSEQPKVTGTSLIPDLHTNCLSR